MTGNRLPKEHTADAARERLRKLHDCGVTRWRRKWKARVQFKGTVYQLGLFQTPEAALTACRAYRARLYAADAGVLP